MSAQPATTGFWCDGFDADLLAVVPGAAEALGDAAELQLCTYGNVTNGKLNHPDVWHGDGGMIAFFGTNGNPRKPASHWTRNRIVDCTMLEAVRDTWLHDCAILLNGAWIGWPPHWELRNKLMYDVRGWTVLDDKDREGIHRLVLAYLNAAGNAALEVVGR